jgi:hypothetical protein
MRDPSSNANVSDITRGPVRHQVGTPTVSGGSPVVTTVKIGAGNDSTECQNHISDDDWPVE